MSGPKLSSVQIAEARRRELERQRQERLRLEEARANYRNAEQEIESRKQQLHLEISQAGEGADFWSGENLKDLKRALEEKLSEIRMYAVIQTSNENEWRAKAEESRREAERIFHWVNEQLGKNKEMADTMRMKEESVIAQYQTAYSISQARQQGRKEKLYIKFEGTAHPVPDPEEQEEINRSNDLMMEQERFNELYISYCALCSVLEKPAKAHSEFKDMDELEKEIESLDRLLEQRDEMAFVADQIDDVMREYEYSVVSSTLLVEENVEKQESIYKVGDQSCIVVYTGSNGEVMMKAAAISHDGYGKVQEEDEAYKHASLQQQISFCRLHPELVEALRERGIYLNQISYLPPSEEYAESVNLDKKKSQRRNRRRIHDKKKMLEMPK